MANRRTYSQVKEEDALHIIKKSIVVDAMVYSPIADLSYLNGLLAAGVVTGLHATWVEPYADTRQALSRICQWYGTFRENADKLLRANNAEDIRNAKAMNKIAIVGGFQNTTPIDRDARLVELFNKLGIKIIQLAYYEQNNVASGCYEASKRADSGLTYFGTDVLQECNRLGVLVDLSHCGDKTCSDAIEHSKSPVAFTHIGARALSGHFRNKSDELIKAVAEKGGVVGALAYSRFIETKQGVRPGVDDYVNHLLHIASVAGIDHVGIGLDLELGWKDAAWSSQYPELAPYTPETEYASGMEDHTSAIVNLTRGLIAHGYSDGEIKKILGENWLNLFERVWKA